MIQGWNPERSKARPSAIDFFVIIKREKPRNDGRNERKNANKK
jgi:hypothetical protein